MAGTIQLVSRPAPKQSRIVEDLRTRILPGELPAGCQLPSTLKMARACKTSVVTVQRGLRHLRKDGFITARKRAGTYVAKNPPHLSNYAMVGPHHVECRFFTAMEQAAHDLFSKDPHKAGPNRSITVYHQAQCRPEDVEASHLSLMEEASRRLAPRRT